MKLRLLLSTICTIAFASQLHGVQDTPDTKNSTTKNRIRPDDLGRKIGSAIAWESNYDTALAMSKKTGKPIFWYVQSVPGTFMDRKDVINDYMLAGPFSWPSIVALINRNCVPLRTIPNAALSNKFQLQVYKFVEPGFLLVRPDQEVTLLANRMTTLHPRWIFRILADALGDRTNWEQNSGNRVDSLEKRTWEKAAASNWQLEESSVENLLKSNSMEAKLLAGMFVFRMGRQDAAKRIWQESSLAHPDHPLAWKAACEAQGIGPFCRGFEVFDSLPESSFAISDKMDISSAALAGTFSEAELWQRSVSFLLGMQSERGGVFDSDYDFGGIDSMPNVYTAVTSLVGMALIEAERKSVDPKRKKEIRIGLDRAVAFVSQDLNMNLNDRDEILWAQAYRVRLLAAMQKQANNNGISSSLQNAVQQLETLQLRTGGWFHEYANSFVSGTALTALFDASQAGATVDRTKVGLGLKRLSSQRYSNGAYPYATRKEAASAEGTEKDLAAAGGRISICELARRRWGEVSDAEFVASVTKSMDYHDLLAKGYKYDNHTSTLAYGGFFFWYDMHARSEAIHLIENQVDRQKLAVKQRELILKLPEIDGCFVDSHELGRCYGTAMALLSLSLLDR